MDDHTQIQNRIAYLSRRVEELERTEKELPYECADWRRTVHELRRVKESLAQARREAELAVDWDDAMRALDELLTSDDGRGAREREALRRRRQFRVIEGGRGVRRSP